MKIATLVASLAGAWAAAMAPVAALDTPASLYEAAKKEGKISIWSSLETSLHQKQWEAFSKTYPGIQIEAFRIQPGPAIERAIAEARAGKQTVDIMDTNSGYLQLLFDRGLVKPYDWEKVFGIPPSAVLYENRVIQIGHYDLPIAYNSSLVKADEIKSWDDLANPKWKGKLLLEARGFGLSILAQEWGVDKTVGYIKKLLDNQPIITKGASPTADGLAGGQGSVAIGALAARLSLFKQQGAPVDWARVGPMPAQVVTVFPVEGAPHPNAAKLWAAWWATPEAQKIFYDEQAYGLLSGPTANPRGKELEKLGVPIVFETADVEMGRRNLEMVAKAIDGLQ